MKKPYLRRIETVGKFVVYEVDGGYIRERLSKEFTNFGQHFRFRFIPKNEFWIDKQHGTDETRYFVDHLLTEWRLMSKKMSYKRAIDVADKRERKERVKSKFYKKLKKKAKNGGVPKEVYRKKLHSYSSDGITTWVVNGEAVRNLYFIDFTEGGHEFVYSFVPKGEVWLDDDLSSHERKFVFLHEVHERNLMAKGMDYEHAHHSSSQIEYFCRHNRSKLRGCIEKELKKGRELKK